MRKVRFVFLMLTLMIYCRFLRPQEMQIGNEFAMTPVPDALPLPSVNTDNVPLPITLHEKLIKPVCEHLLYHSAHCAL